MVRRVSVPAPTKAGKHGGGKTSKGSAGSRQPSTSSQPGVNAITSTAPKKASKPGGKK